ncbi:hypothetical protein HZA43_05415 [Candidatus Peregrinibacteria bacterium]|nr:hypothetical protein [Candidatus Peregrinibacteria bacterium]
MECDDPDVAGDTALQTQRKAALARAAHVAGQRLRYDLEKRGCPPLPDQSDASAKQ